MPDLQHELVQDREQWYASRPDYMQRMTERSSKYLFHIVEELERRSMPPSWPCCPTLKVLSTPRRSPAPRRRHGQFMPATGSYFDLKQNAFRDDRRDVLASTRAALDYLQKNSMACLATGTWPWRPTTGVKAARAIARNQKQGLGTSHTDLNMPAETRMYVPKLQAVKTLWPTRKPSNRVAGD